MFDFDVIRESLPQFLSGTWLSIHLVVLSLSAGLAIAIPFAIAANSRNPWVRRPVASYVYFFRGTPMLIQLLLIYYGLSQFEWMQAAWADGHPFWILFREPYFCAWLAFALNTGAYTTEIIAGSMRHIPHGEIEAAQAMGMTRFTQLRRIILPGALRRAIPAYSNEVILMLHATSLASIVTLLDLTGAAREVNSRHYLPFEAFLTAGLFYLALSLALVALFQRAEQRWLAHLQPRR